MKALSVRQPWAWAIIYALKNVENRGWPIHYRGDILIHAAKTCTKKDYQLAREFCHSMGVVTPELISLRRGQVIGIVTIVDCKFSQVASGWGMPGQYHWKLENPREITPIPYIGRLGIFEVPDELVRSAIARVKSVLSLFSGIGGLCHHGISAAGLSHKFRVQQFVEISPYSQSQLRHEQPEKL
ncbi:MAG: ASCH domain-containing protein [Nostoc sp.]